MWALDRPGKHRVWGLECQIPVRANVVVAVYRPGHRVVRGGEGGEDGVEIEFVLQDAIDAFGLGTMPFGNSHELQATPVRRS